jgi:hypothetical protein
VGRTATRDRAVALLDLAARAEALRQLPPAEDQAEVARRQALLADIRRQLAALQARR